MTVAALWKTTLTSSSNNLIDDDEEEGDDDDMFADFAKYLRKSLT